MYYFISAVDGFLETVLITSNPTEISANAYNIMIACFILKEALNLFDNFKDYVLWPIIWFFEVHHAIIHPIKRKKKKNGLSVMKKTVNMAQTCKSQQQQQQ